ncbi:MAG TPA: hypothetical protein VN749_04840 [Candidatus Eisenbacteria bacterium]|nr:hypothetical protein [Candidatus Eisenbacteria bacterium]
MAIATRKDGFQRAKSGGWPLWLTVSRSAREIALRYLDDIVSLVPGSAREERAHENEIKTEIIVFPKGSRKQLPPSELARNKEN